MSALQKKPANAALVGQLRHQAGELQRAGLSVFGHRTTEAADLIERLDRVEAAARNLVDQKGRHNTEVAYRRLAEALSPAAFAQAEAAFNAEPAQLAGMPYGTYGGMDQ